MIDHRAGVGAGDQVWPGFKVKLCKIGPGTKRSASARDDQGPNQRVRLGLVQRLPQIMVHLPGETVERQWAVQGQQGHCALLKV